VQIWAQGTDIKEGAAPGQETDLVPKFAPPPLAVRGRRQDLSVPLRTWLLLVLACGALLGVMFIDDLPWLGEVGDSPARATKSKRSAVRRGAVAKNASPEQKLKRGVAPASEAKKKSAPETGMRSGVIVRPTTLASGDAPVMSESRAAELLVRGSHIEALAGYAELSTQHPENEAFAAIHGILAKRVDERCPQGGEPCAE